ncbi:hypothetical protein [Nostoc sp. ChiSLP03a]|uniref:hypothetical protein n=1 Tax=Nostoc sp. ChiSLP03a TaxID=3075380 RepID=UPI002AD428ED|nr:hypothetical protein [Nostoc sp. ChiSLP03a]MDZ8212629.1 hypothetical protein [Nostoc sp. ChiSLP03a]
MDKNNFEAFTNLPAFKKNAIQVCGQEFIDSLIKKGIYAKTSEFWKEINKKLNIPDDAYESKQAREKAERKQVFLEKKLKSKRKNKDCWQIKKKYLLKTEKIGKLLFLNFQNQIFLAKNL